jgi:nitrous oxidase accessory protein
LFSQETLTKNLCLKLVLSRNLDKNSLITEIGSDLMGNRMRKIATLLIVLFILMPPNVVVVQPINTEPSTIIVPADYPTIAAAINNATDGDIIFVKKGIYTETPFRINKTLSLIGEGADATIISFNPPYTEVTVNILERYTFYEDPIVVVADDFTLSGFNITSSGGSISITGNRTRITNNVITREIYVAGGSGSVISDNFFTGGVGFNGTYCKVSSNSFWCNLYGGGQYVIFSSNNCHWGRVSIVGDDCLVNDNQLSQSSSAFSVGGINNIVSKNTIEHVGFGLSVAGLNSKAFLNQVTHCGIGLIPSAGSIFFANYIANNGWGIDTGGDLVNPNGTLSTIFHNNFANNRYQVDTMGSYETDYYDNGKEGNYWDDYQGKDANGDGIGDTVYAIDENRSDRYPLMAPFDIDSVTLELPDWASPPSVRLISPENTTYNSRNVTLEFTVNKLTSWMGYSLDGQEAVSITGNTTLFGLSSGLHNVTIYAEDPFENIATSETILFSITEAFPTTLVIAAFVVSMGLIVVGLRIYFKKWNNESEVRV